MPATLPDFFLVNPVARSFVIGDRFNAPRDYAFAPDKLQKHEGIDLVAIDAQRRPVAVLAAQRGVVDRVAFSPSGYGNYVRIVHDWKDGKWVTWYGHLSETSVSPGQFVLAGQKIGVAGDTGYSFGIHLHLTLQHIGHGLSGYTVRDVVDPEPFFHMGAIPAYDDFSYVSDVTAPDGTEMQPGQQFRKVWRVRNTGTTTWDAGYKLAFAGEEQMGGPDQVVLPTTPVEPGQLINVAVELLAPGEAGRHRSVWSVQNSAGEMLRHRLYAEIAIQVQEMVDEASYVADVTIEDGTLVQPGEEFVKTWRIRNTGTTTWDEEYALRFDRGERMNGPDGIPLPRQVRPGEIVDLSVRLTAPREAGRHRSYWRMHNAAGNSFRYVHFVEIRVPEAPADPAKLNEARYVADVTIPDGKELRPGEPFVKTWRIRNSGTTTWGDGYRLAFFDDEDMEGPESVPLPRARPGETVEVSVPLVAPTTPGEHKSTWKPRDPDGNVFEFDFFALINVIAEEAVIDELSWVADVTVDDGMIMQPGERFLKTWRVRNTGTTTWDRRYTLGFFGDQRMDGPSGVSLPSADPGEAVDITIMLTAPTTPGPHKSTWKGRSPRGQFFDYDLFALIEVADPDQTYDMLTYLKGDGRLYELAYSWDSGGHQRIQTQEEGGRFYIVKGAEWEELWADEHFIYRGTDTSPGGDRVYVLTEQGHYGSAWIPRFMTVGVRFRRTPIVTFRRKSDGEVLRTFPHVTWIELEAIKHRTTFPNGFEVEDVAILAAYEDEEGSPAAEPFERYFFARGYGLVAWGGQLGHSEIVREFAPGSQPNNQREALPWLNR